MSDPGYKTKNTKGAATIVQQKYNDYAKADKHISTIVAPSSINNDISSIFKVGKGNLCRIIDLGSTASYVVFGDSTVTTPNSSTVNAFYLPADGDVYVIAQDDYIIASQTLRVEVIED